MFGPAHGSGKQNALRLASSLTRGTALGETDHAPNSPRPLRKNCHQTFPPNPKFNRPSANYPIIFPKPSPRTPPLHSLHQSHPPCRTGTSVPRLVEGTHGDPLAPTVRSRRSPSSSRAATAGDVLVEAHGGQRRHRWRRSCGDARWSTSPTVCAF